MANRQTIGLGAVILGIVLAAGLGIRGAASWLSGSTSETTDRNGLVSDGSTGAAGTNVGNNNSEFGLTAADSVNQSADSREQIVGQANTTDSTQPLSPLEEAGTYIQRQKRVDQDPVVANTPVEVIPTASNNTVASQSDTTSSQSTAPAASPAATDPVPALW
ncbi:MAG: hypothetical protein AAF703_19490 [Cyanobacteria bacterium P01_D01_bin.105]